MNQRLVHRTTRSLLSGENNNVWQDIDLRVDTEPFCTSCKISTRNKHTISNTPLNPRTPFKWVLMYIIPALSSKSLAKETKFSNCLLFLDAYSKLPRLYGMENITTEEVIDKLENFQSKFGKVDKFGWWDLE